MAKGATKKKIAPHEVRIERLGKIVGWVCEGMPTAEIVDATMAAYKVSRSQALRYLAKVRHEVLPQLHEHGQLKVLTAEAIVKAEALMRRALNEGEIATALGCLKWIGELQGLTAAQRLNAELAQLREEISRLKTARGGHGLTLEHYNRIRATYGMPEKTQEEWEEAN